MPATTAPGPDPDSDVMGLPEFSAPRIPATPDPAPPDSGPDDSDRPAASAAPGGMTTSIPAFFRQRSKSYAKIAEALLQAAGGWLNKAAATDSGAFLPDDDDTETIPPPLGRLAARRVKVGADPDSLTDIEDIGIAAIGLAVWLAKGVTALLNDRRERRRLEAGKAVHTETGDGQ